MRAQEAGKGFAATSGIVAPALFRDEFNGASGTTNAGRKPSPVNNVGAVWRAGSAAFTIQENHLEPPASFADGDYQVLDVRTPDFTYTASEGYIAASASRPVYKNGLWYIVYQGAPGQIASGPIKKWLLYAASSPDLLKWTRLNGDAPILPLGAPYAFDRDGQHDPDLRLRTDGSFEVFFSGRRETVFTAGYALSTNMTTWSPSKQLAAQGQFGAGTDIGNVSVAGDDPKAYSLYFTHISAAGERYINRADTTDGGATLTYYDGVLYKGLAASWESAQVFDPDALTSAGALYLFYSAGSCPAEPRT